MSIHCYNNSSKVKIHALLYSTSTIGVWSWLCCVVDRETFVEDAHLASTSYSAKSEYAHCLVVRRIALDQHRGGGAWPAERRKPGETRAKRLEDDSLLGRPFPSSRRPSRRMYTPEMHRTHTITATKIALHGTDV
jgi:hypothetical protein